MFINSIQSYYLRAIPRKIDTNLSKLRDQLEIFTKHGDLYGLFDQYREGFGCLKERWHEYKIERNPSKEIVEDKEKKLQECAEIIEKLRILSLTPKIKKDKIALSESREDISLFETEEQKQQAVQNALQKLEQSSINRDLWVAQSCNVLALCACNASDKYRAEHEKDFLRTIIERYPPHPSFELCLMSLGSGKLMQDWLLLQQLEQAGYKKVYLHLIDPATTQEMVHSLNNLISIYLKNSVAIVHSQAYLDPENIEVCRPCHAIHALDFDSILYFPCQQGAWKSLLTASECLRDHGLLFCSAFGEKYWFDAENGQWKLPFDSSKKIHLREHEGDKQEKPIVFGVTDIKHFWGMAFYYLADLTKMKKDIKVEVITENNDIKSLSNICNIVKKILAPNGEIDIKLEYATENNEAIYDMFYGTEHLIDEKFLDEFVPKIKKNGVMILNPHSGYQSDDIVKKTILRKQYDDTVESIKEYAEALAISHSLQLHANW